MKKLFFLFIALACLFVMTNIACAESFQPRYSDTIKEYGIGVYLAPKLNIIFSKPEDDAEVVQLIQWDNLGVHSAKDEVNTRQALIAFAPDKDLAVFTVTDENDNWYQIVYNQGKGDKGWVRKADNGKFLTWYEFLNTYGRKNGIYFFSDLSANYKQIHTGPSDDSQLLKDHPYYTEMVELKFIRGNWMLVKMVDFDKSAPVGWIRWRDDKGKIFVFPKLSG